MYKQQILYTNTYKVCYLQFLMSTSQGEMWFIDMSIVTQQNCISGYQLVKMAKECYNIKTHISGKITKCSHKFSVRIYFPKKVKMHYLEIQNC